MKIVWRPYSPPLSHCCPLGRVHAARLATAAHGACHWPGACAYLDAVYGAEMGGDTTVRPWSTATDSSSPYAIVPHRRANPAGARTGRGDDDAGACFFVHLAMFDSMNIKNLEYKLQFSKNKSCRGTIGLQLVQMETYILMFRLTGIT
jgi:hypothetical protein